MPPFTASLAFKVWAKGWSGTNGGNLNAPLWFCGLEFGTGEKTPTLRSHQPYSVDGVPCWNEVFRAKHHHAISKSPYLRKMAKIALVARGEALKEYAPFLNGSMLGPHGGLFHTNLYPLPFKDTKGDRWTEEHFKLTGLPGKVAYRAWCMEHRFPWLYAQMMKANPRVLVCTGSTFEEDFRLAFLPDRLFRDGEPHPLPSKKMVYVFRKENTPTIILTPFLGQGGIMSNADMSALGAMIKTALRA